MDDSMTGDAVTQKQIDRRTAMKAALGGAAAAAAMSAPGIEAFSFAPDFAAAASQCPAGSTVNGSPATISRPNCTSGLTKCWGNCTCSEGNLNFASVGTITVNAASPSYGDPTFAVSVGGQVKSGTNNNLSLTVANFTVNQPFSSCTVTISGACTGGSSATATISNGLTGSNTVTANGTTNGRIKCPGNVVQSPSGTITVAASCICGA